MKKQKYLFPLSLDDKKRVYFNTLMFAMSQKDEGYNINQDETNLMIKLIIKSFVEKGELITNKKNLCKSINMSLDIFDKCLISLEQKRYIFILHGEIFICWDFIEEIYKLFYSDFIESRQIEESNMTLVTSVLEAMKNRETSK